MPTDKKIKPIDMGIEMQLHAFERGFESGAQLKRKHVLGPPEEHKHWQAGYKKGLAARYDAARDYKVVLEHEKEKCQKEGGAKEPPKP